MNKTTIYKRVVCALNCKDPGGERFICQGQDRADSLGDWRQTGPGGETGKIHLFLEKEGVLERINYLLCGLWIQEINLFCKVDLIGMTEDIAPGEAGISEVGSTMQHGKPRNTPWAHLGAPEQQYHRP